MKIVKLRPARPEREQYEKLRRAIFHRDGWRSQFCGTMTNLEVHHQQFRSRSGQDAQENLITQCHSRRLAVQIRAAWDHLSRTMGTSVQPSEGRVKSTKLLQSWCEFRRSNARL